MTKTGLELLLSEIAGRLTRDEVNENEINAIRAKAMPDVDVDSFKLLFKRFSLLLKNISSSDMGDAQLDAYLTSMVKKKDSGLRFEDAWAVGEWWKKERASVVRRLEEAVVWDQQLVGVRAQIRASVSLGEPSSDGDDHQPRETRSAVLDLSLANPDRTLQVEVSKSGIEALLRELRAVDAEIRRCCNPDSSA